jgi:hypothetical protein
METKTCCKCKENKLLSLFSKNKSKKDGHNTSCKDCQKSYKDCHYSKNKKTYLDRKKKNQIKRAKIFYDWLKTESCVDCGNSDIRVLEFDHQRDKSFNIASKIKDMTFETLQKEIEKCEVVCANCHRIRTAVQNNWYSYLD